jgi:haloalkane dehalogenase
MTAWYELKRRAAVLDKSMAYVETGAGRPILFLHGNPTSSYLWRNVVPELVDLGRCLAPDLIGMGDSDKLEPGPDTYRFSTHSRYLDAFIEAVVGPTEPLVLVLHDWGSALGFHWANRNRRRVAGIAYMEGIVRPFAGWREWSEAATPIFQGFRSEAGERLVLERNLFVERVLPGSVLRELSAEEMAEYRRPFIRSEDRWPTLTWPRQIPIGGDPAEVVDIVQAYADWLAASDVPKLFINAEPGAILTGPARDFCRTWPNQDEVTVEGSHFIQEDSGPEIGRTLRGWLTTTLNREPE